MADVRTNVCGRRRISKMLRKRLPRCSPRNRNASGIYCNAVSEFMGRRQNAMHINFQFFFKEDQSIFVARWIMQKKKDDSGTRCGMRAAFRDRNRNNHALLPSSELREKATLNRRSSRVNIKISFCLRLS